MLVSRFTCPSHERLFANVAAVSMNAPPVLSRWLQPRIQARLHAVLGIAGLAQAAILLSPKIPRLLAADSSVFGRGLLANLALVFGSLMFLRNARFFHRQDVARQRSKVEL